MKLKKFAAVLSALCMMMTTANGSVVNAFITASAEESVESKEHTESSIDETQESVTENTMEESTDEFQETLEEDISEELTDEFIENVSDDFSAEESTDSQRLTLGSVNTEILSRATETS